MFVKKYFFLDFIFHNSLILPSCSDSHLGVITAATATVLTLLQCLLLNITE
jgi:hypothetical protein